MEIVDRIRLVLDADWWQICELGSESFGFIKRA